MSLINDLFQQPSTLSTASKYTVVNGAIYLGIGVLLVGWPGVVQNSFQGSSFCWTRGSTH